MIHSTRLRDLQDAYYEAAHKGGCYAKNVYANKISKYMNIDITRALKEIDNSLYIVEGEAENNGEATVEAYQNINPSVETVTLNETKHFPRRGSGTFSGTGWNFLLMHKPCS